MLHFMCVKHEEGVEGMEKEACEMNFMGTCGTNMIILWRRQSLGRECAYMSYKGN